MNRDDAEDAIQEAMIRLTIRLHVLDVDGHLLQEEQCLLAWLTTTAWRVTLDHRRNVHPTVSLSEDCLALDDMPCATDLTEVIHLRLTVNPAWNALDDADRRLLQLKAQGESCASIAQLYRLSEETAKKRLQRARARFARELKKVGLELPN